MTYVYDLSHRKVLDFFFGHCRFFRPEKIASPMENGSWRHDYAFPLPMLAVVGREMQRDLDWIWILGTPSTRLCCRNWSRWRSLVNHIPRSSHSRSSLAEGRNSYGTKGTMSHWTTVFEREAAVVFLKSCLISPRQRRNHQRSQRMFYGLNCDFSRGFLKSPPDLPSRK